MYKHFLKALPSFLISERDMDPTFTVVNLNLLYK